MGGENRNTMIVLQLIEENSLANLVFKELSTLNTTVIRYRDPVRVLDSIAELKPGAVVMRQKDFPLHAQLLTALLKFYTPLQHCKMIILGNDERPFPSCSFVRETLFLKDPSILLNEFADIPHTSSHRGSRLVAKAQRMVKE